MRIYKSISGTLHLKRLRTVKGEITVYKRSCGIHSASEWVLKSKVAVISLKDLHFFAAQNQEAQH